MYLENVFVDIGTIWIVDDVAFEGILGIVGDIVVHLSCLDS
jgi:hypothetical protein